MWHLSVPKKIDVKVWVRKIAGARMRCTSTCVIAIVGGGGGVTDLSQKFELSADRSKDLQLFLFHAVS